MTPTRRNWALGTFVAAVAFRVFLFFSGWIDPNFETGDSPEYRALAESLLKHGVFGVDGVPKMNRTPGFPAFLALVYATVGRSQIAVTGAQIALDALVCVMVVDLAYRMRLGRAACAVVAALSVTCVFTCAYSYQVMTETLYTFALVASIWILPLGGITALVRRDARWRIAVSGLCAGYATLVRPSHAVTVVAFVGIAMLLLWKAVGRRSLGKKPLIAAAILGATTAVVVVPLMIRNRVVFHAEYEKPDHSHVTLLGFKTDASVYRHWYTPDFMTFKRSFEEPFIMEVPYRRPSIVRYVYPGEPADIDRAFDDLAHEITTTTDTPITPETLAEFRAIGEKRYRTAPRLHLTAPLSRIGKFWIVPRVSVLWFKHAGQVSTVLAVLLTGYNCLYVLPGIFALFAPFRRARGVWIGIVALLVSQTALYSFWQSMPQSRYAVPFFPLLSLGCGVLVARVIARRRRRAAT